MVFVGITAVVGAAVVGVCPATVVLRQEHDGRREKTCVRPPFVAQDYSSLLQGTLSIALKDIFLAAYNRNGLRWEVLLCSLLGIGSDLWCAAAESWGSRV